MNNVFSKLNLFDMLSSLDTVLILRTEVLANVNYINLNNYDLSVLYGNLVFEFMDKPNHIPKYFFLC